MSDEPAHDGNPLLRTEKLTNIYNMGQTRVVALDSVDFVARSGEFIVILGPSGSGKSTFLNLVGGLDTATSGQAWFRDQQITGLGDAALTRYRRNNVGFVFQFYNLVPSLTARENVRLVTEIAKSPMRAEEALDMVDLADRMDHFPAQLSGGEQQRVAIARAIAKRPDGVARLRTLTLGHRNTEHAEVMTGLSPGETIIIHPGDNVVDGRSVTSWN